MERNYVDIQASEDVTADCLKQCEDVFEGWFDSDDPIDWYSFWDRLEAYGYTVKNTDCPATRKIQRHIRAFRNLA
jgi:hypothetical protein